MSVFREELFQEPKSTLDAPLEVTVTGPSFERTDSQCSM